MRVIICEGCRLSDPPPDAPADGRALAESLRARLAARGQGRRVLVEGAACLDVCGEGVTVAIEDGDRREILSYPADLEAALARLEGATAGGLVDRCRVGLSLHGEALDPAEITRLLGVEPTRAHRPGEARSSRGRAAPPWRAGTWVLDLKGAAPRGPEQLLGELLDRLPSDPRVWEALRARHEVRLGLAVYLDDWNRGFSLEPALLQRVAALGLGLDVEIYGALDQDEPEA